MKRKSEKDVSSSSEEDLEDEDEEEESLKVFFCSRTHSQLSQFVGELQRTKFAASLQSVSLGSRKTLCINPGKHIRFQSWQTLLGTIVHFRRSYQQALWFFSMIFNFDQF